MKLTTLLLLIFGMFIGGIVEFVWYKWDVLLYTTMLLFLAQYV